MDPVAHTFVGAALAQTGLGRRTAFGAAALIIGANLPDVDGIAMFLSTDTALFVRRGWTHGLPAVAVLPLLLTVLLTLAGRRLRRSSKDPPLRAGTLAGLSYLAVATHPSLDWLNTYGMRWLMPFRERWFYGDSVFIIDPWMWLVLGGAVFLFHSRRGWSFVGWAAFAGLASFLLFSAVSGLAAAKALWLAGILSLGIVRATRGGLDTAVASRIATSALVAVSIYVAVMVASARYAREAVMAALDERGIQVEELMVGPVPVTPFVRDVVVRTPDGHRYGEARLLPRFELVLAARTLPLLADTPVVRLATASPDARGFMTWARFPFAEVEERARAFIVYLMDARYTRSRTAGFGAARVVISKDELEATLE